MIECNLVGRAGNQMFEYAMCRTLGEAKGFDWCINPAQWVCNDLFNLSFGGRGGEPITKEYHETILEYDPRIWDIEDGTLINGYFQSEQYFDNAKARKWFKLYPDGEATIITEKYPIDEYCYINLRGTDVKELGCQKLSLDYYRNAIEVIHTIKPDLNFIVITDDIPFGKEYFPDFPVMSNTVRTDFCALNRAKYVILADSSFAWWAAWLNQNNTVIAPHGWLNVNINKWLFAPKDIKVNRWIWV